MRRFRWLAFLLVMVLALGGGVAAAFRGEAPTSAPRYITDDQGRALILHGFNTASSAKGTPDAMPEFAEADVAREYTDMGTNFVRFLLQWRAVEPEPGQYDRAYLDKVAQRVSWYADRGYHVLLDMHQDLYSPYITETGDAGNGAPQWATRMDGLPVGQNDQWEMYYLEPGVIRAFDNFWGTTGDDSLMNHYAKAWGAVADYFANDPAVLGYDLMNEPWGGSVQGAAFETGPLAELYRRSIAQIRTVDTDSWIFVEPQAVGVNWSLPSSLPHFDDPREGEDRIGFAPHVYPLPMDLGDTYSGDGKSQIDTSLTWWQDNVLRTAARLDAPVLLGEFGYDATIPGTLDYVEEVTRVADDTGMGWAYWSRDPGSWGPYDDKGAAQPLVEVLNRAYPRAIAGEPLSIEYDPQGLRLSLAFRSAEEIGGATEIYLPTGFGDGGQLDCGGDCQSSWDAERRILSVTTDPDIPQHQLIVTAK